MIFLIISLVILLIYLLLCFITYKMVFYTGYKKDKNIYNIPNNDQFMRHYDYMVKLINDFKDVDAEDVYIKSFDGKVLHARYYKVSDNNIVDLCFHGYRGTAIRDFCGGRKICFDTLHNLLVVDQRGHGLSAGHTLTFGIKEKYDLKCWVEYLNNRFNNDVKIMLYGVSMGAATVLMASNLDLGNNVKGIIADSPYSSVEGIIKKVCVEDKKIPYGLVKLFVHSAALLFCGIKLKDGEVINSTKESRYPILIIHGEADNFVPCDMSLDIYNSNKEMITRYTFENAGHGISYIEDEERYKKIVIEFLDTKLK